ncbi:hypothetical protein MILUP08_45882 [Micromonospora lupini str. Lupac 08]|uniref:Uncharacterized protein n=1 Tax=Micromonospora lupini str. Lupac 08 TaxID=1150864 RepID=I0LAZ2_9ACTN|nr:hypothetical protein MILUP08_45882 [Micromonospora lupini str. Lupac 08]
MRRQGRAVETEPVRDHPVRDSLLRAPLRSEGIAASGGVTAGAACPAGSAGGDDPRPAEALWKATPRRRPT